MNNASIRQSSPLLWALIAGLVFVLYYGCLRFIFPGYFAPLTVFHPDFYDYTGALAVPIRALMHYPRPVSSVAMHWLALAGLRGLMSWGIVIALAGIWLTIALAARLLCIPARMLIAGATLYCFCLFTHPDFYFEHRHDLPAEIAYLFLLLAAHSWLSGTQEDASAAKRALYCACSALCLLASVLSKETFLLSAFFLPAAFALARRDRWRVHVCFCFLIIAAVAFSMLWNHGLQGPFVNPGAAASDPYRIDLSPRSILKCWGYYLRHLFTPAMLFLFAGSIWLHRSTPRLVVLLCLCLAGLAAYAPHSLLPNHVYEEYAFIGAPLVFLPLVWLPYAVTLQKQPLRFTAAALLLLISTFWWPDGYRRRYHVWTLIASLNQEKLNQQFVQSWPLLKALPSTSRILVTGLPSECLPWFTENFDRMAFGAEKQWTILIPRESAFFPHGNSLATPVVLPHIDLKNIDYIAEYDPTGHLSELKGANEASLQVDHPATLVPVLASDFAQVHLHPTSVALILQAANDAVTWGANSDAQALLDSAQALGLARDPKLLCLEGQLAANEGDWSRSIARFDEAVANGNRDWTCRHYAELARAHQWP